MRKGLKEKIDDLKDAFRRDQTEPLVLMRSVWQRISKDVVSLGGGKLNLPYSAVKVAILAQSEGQKNIFKAALEQDRRLEKFLREKLREENCDAADRFRVAVDFVYTRPNAWGKNVFSVVPDLISNVDKTPSARLVILKGKAGKKQYKIEKRRTYIGRLKDVKDVDGRIIRRNDIVFEDSGDKTNTSVGRLHACLEFDTERNRFTLEDTGGSTGTRIERHGDFLDVQVNQRVSLKDRDVIHLGRASIQFVQQEGGK